MIVMANVARRFFHPNKRSFVGGSVGWALKQENVNGKKLSRHYCVGYHVAQLNTMGAPNSIGAE